MADGDAERADHHAGQTAPRRRCRRAAAAGRGRRELRPSRRSSGSPWPSPSASKCWTIEVHPGELGVAAGESDDAEQRLALRRCDGLGHGLPLFDGATLGAALYRCDVAARLIGIVGIAGNRGAISRAHGAFAVEPPRYRRYKLGCARNTGDTKPPQHARLGGYRPMPISRMTRTAAKKATRKRKSSAKRSPPSARRPRSRRSTSVEGQRDDERNALALDSINESVYDWNVETDEVYFSPSLRVMLGLKPEQPITREDWASADPSGRPGRRTGRRCSLISGARPSASKSEFRYRAADGSWRWARQHGIAATRCATAAYAAWSAPPATSPRSSSASVSCSRPGPRSSPRSAMRSRSNAINENLYDWDIDTDTVYYAPGLYRDPRAHARAAAHAEGLDRPHPSRRPVAVQATRWPSTSRARRRASRWSCATATAPATGAGRGRPASRCAAPTAARTAWSARPATSPRPSATTRR